MAGVSISRPPAPRSRVARVKVSLWDGRDVVWPASAKGAVTGDGGADAPSVPGRLSARDSSISPQLGGGCGRRVFPLTRCNVRIRE